MHHDENTIANLLSPSLTIIGEHQADRRRSRFGSDHVYNIDFLYKGQEECLEKDLMPKLNRHRSSFVESSFGLELESAPSVEIHNEDTQFRLTVTLEQEKRGSFCPEFMKTNSTSLREEVLRVFQEQNKEGVSDEELKEGVMPQIDLRMTSTFGPNIQHEEFIPSSIQETEGSQGKVTETHSNMPEVKKRGRKSPFTPEDDKLLEELVQKYGEKNWSQIASIMKKFNRKQLRERYINFIKKKYIFTEFTEEEDIKIVSCVEKFGRKWERISEEFENRSPIMIKNHYVNSILKGKCTVEKDPSYDSNFIPSGSMEAVPAISLSPEADLKGGKRAWDGCQYTFICPPEPEVQEQIKSATQQISKFQLQ